MPDTLIAFNLLLLLLSGLITLKVREALAIVARVSDFSRAIDALLFTLLNNAVGSPSGSGFSWGWAWIEIGSTRSGANLP